jgi:hypothetical protein
VLAGLAPGEWSVPGLAAELGMPTATIYNWIYRGWITARHAPGSKNWIITADSAGLVDTATKALTFLLAMPSGPVLSNLVVACQSSGFSIAPACKRICKRDAPKPAEPGETRHHWGDERLTEVEVALLSAAKFCPAAAQRARSNHLSANPAGH